MSWCSDAPEDEAISLFAGLLANPDVRLSLMSYLIGHHYFFFCVCRNDNLIIWWIGLV